MKNFLMIAQEVIKGFKGFYLKIAGLFFLSLITVVMSLYISIINQMTIDKVFYARDINYLFHFMIYIFIGIYIFSITINILNSYLQSKTYSKIDAIFKLKFYKKIVYSSFYFYNTHDSSDIYYRMFNDLSYLVQYFLNMLIVLPTNLLYVICAIILMFNWSYVLTLVFLAILAVNIVVIIIIKKPIYNINANQRIIEQNLVTRINNALGKVLSIKVFGIENLHIDKMKNNFTEYIKANVKNKFLLSMLTVCSNLSSQIWSLLQVIIGAILVYKGHLTVGAFISFSGVASASTSITSQLVNTVFSYQVAKLSYNRCREYNGQAECFEYDGNEKFSLEDSMIVKNLNYSYPKSNRKVISDLNFKVNVGQTVAIIGENGKGKSTLMDLIDRLIIPNSGSIMIDENNINKVKYDELRKNIGYALQRPIIFNSSIKENIVLGRDGISMERIWSVLNGLGMSNYLKTLPKKLDTVIGENGYKLSIGNMQKISLARVFVRDYRILILDEPTSSLDIDSQKNFFNLLNKYKLEHKSIVLLVTHKKSEIGMSDIMLYINGDANTRH